MAYTNEQLALLNATFDALPDGVKAMFNAQSSQDTAAAIATIIAQRRKASMQETVGALVSTTVQNWTSLREAATVADGATLNESLRSFDEALTAGDAAALGSSAIAVCLAARKHFGIAP